MITGEGIAKDQDKVATMLSIQPPTTVKQVQAFNGLVTYYSKFLPRLADMMHPFYALLKKGVHFEWNEQRQLAFEKIKRIIADDLVLAHYNPQDPLILIECIQQLFARFGLPREVVTDNGTGFTSTEFGDFLAANGIKHSKIAPGHPATNGLAENAVKTVTQH